MRSSYLAPAAAPFQYQHWIHPKFDVIHTSFLRLAATLSWGLLGTAHADLQSAIDTSESVSTSGSANWFDQSTTTHDTIDAAQSGNVSDNDNRPNGLEAYLGSSPTVKDPGSPVTSTVSHFGGTHLVIEFDREVNPPNNLTANVYTGTTLNPAAMSKVATQTGGGSWSGNASVIEQPPSGGKVHVIVRDQIYNQSRRFGFLELVPSP